jgi:hypothetical protein
MTGNFKNGDLITSGIRGYGIKQNDNVVRNITAAKITMDCNFKRKSGRYICKSFKYKGVVYKKALVGCIYKF